LWAGADAPAHSSARKQFFSEENSQKVYVEPIGASDECTLRSALAKVFWFSSPEKNVLPYLEQQLSSAYIPSRMTQALPR
jgi:hypothetical protein